MISIVKAYNIAVEKKKKKSHEGTDCTKSKDSRNITRNRFVLYIYLPLCFVTFHSNTKLQMERECHFVLKFYSKILS